MCNLLQSSTTTPVYSLTSPTYQPYPRATATPTVPIPPHITPHGTPSTPTIPPSPSTPHPPKLKVTVREMVEGNNIAENSVEFPVFSITSIKHQILLLTPDCFIACIILSYALFFTLSNTHTHTHTHTASAAADSAGDVQGEPNSHQRAESSHPWLHGWSKRSAAIALSLHSPVQI